jgi:hypothetical protein
MYEEVDEVDQRLTNIQSMLGENQVLICFSGRFSQGIIEELGEAIKKRMENEDKSKNDIYNVFSIFIEQTQNIKNYVAAKEGGQMYEQISNSSIVCIGKAEDRYFIWSGNVIENPDIQPLREKLVLVSGLSKEELKKIYKETIKREIEPGSRGAGIGLIDIARKATFPVEYSFETIDETVSFYQIRVIV